MGRKEDEEQKEKYGLTESTRKRNEKMRKHEKKGDEKVQKKGEKNGGKIDNITR